MRYNISHETAMESERGHRAVFNMDIGELALVLAVAFLIVGPKELPRVARWIARQIKTIKRLVRELKQETGWDEFEKEFRDTAEDVKQTVAAADIRRDVTGTAEELRAVAEDVHREVTAAEEALRSDEKK